MTPESKYLSDARKYASKLFSKRRDTFDNHESFLVEEVLLATEAKFPNLKTHGVEGDCEANGEGHITIQYLNTGDSYKDTIVYYKGKFRVTNWGSIVENMEPSSC